MSARLLCVLDSRVHRSQLYSPDAWDRTAIFTLCCLLEQELVKRQVAVAEVEVHLQTVLLPHPEVLLLSHERCQFCAPSVHLCSH